MTRSAADRLDHRNRSAFAEAEREGLMLAAMVRNLALCVVVIWVAVDHPDRGWTLAYGYDLLEVSSFIFMGVLQYFAARHASHVEALKYIFVAVDCALLGIITASPNPFASYDLPPAILMNGSQFAYFYLILMQTTFSFRPSLVLWCGASIMAVRTGMLLWFASQPGTRTNWDLPEQTVEAFVAARADGHFLYLGFWAQEVITCLLVSAGLAALVARSRRLVSRRTLAERSRAALARYFSPNVVDRLGAEDGLARAGREQIVAVLFVDIVGFTQMAEADRPQAVVAFLRMFHDRLGRAVFDNGGTLDKYLGDGLMASFGTPDPGPRDGANALACAFDMLAALKDWNRERAVAGQAPVCVGIGVHIGPVVAGDIGSDQRLEYSVIGDTVNVASRLEHLTRELQADLVVSDDLVQAATTQASGAQPLLARLTQAGSVDIRGRREPVGVWTASG